MADDDGLRGDDEGVLDEGATDGVGVDSSPDVDAADADADADADAERPRTRYRILNELGRGGMGVVYHAVQVDGERPVALKLIRGELLSKPRMLQRFRREVRALRKLRHPNLVALYDHKTRGTSHYLAMEYVDGPDLQVFVRDNPNPPREFVLGLARDVASAMEYFHGHGIIHRDLKPRNILLTSTLQAKVSDFGLSKHLDLTSITALGVQVGTPRYMSPEIVKGARVDHRSDIYQLGLILYFVLTGRPAHAGETVQEVMTCCVKGTMPPPRELVPLVDQDLSDFVMRLLSREPDMRPAHAGEVLALLSSLERGSRPEHPVTPPPAVEAEPAAPAGADEARPRRTRFAGPRAASMAPPSSAIPMKGGPPPEATTPPPSLSPDASATPLSQQSLGAAVMTMALSGLRFGRKGSAPPGPRDWHYALAGGCILSVMVLPLLWVLSAAVEGGGFRTSDLAVSVVGTSAKVTWRSEAAYPSRVGYRRDGDDVVGNRGTLQGEAVTDHEAVIEDLVPRATYLVWVELPDGGRSKPVTFVAGDAAPMRGVDRSTLERRVAESFATLRGPDPSAAAEAADALTALRGDAAFEVVRGYVESSHRVERAWAARAMTAMDGRRAAPFLVRLLGDRFKMVRDTAIDCLGSCGSERVVDLLEPALVSGSTDVRCAAVAALARLGGEAAVQRMVQVLDDTDGRVRMAAVEGLGTPAASGLVTELVRRMEAEGSVEGRALFLETLGRVGSPAGLGALKRQAGSRDELVRGAALTAVARVDGARALPFLDGYLRSGDLTVTCQAVDALGETGCEEGLATLRQILATATGKLRRRALRAAGRLPIRQARELLVDLAASTDPLDRADALLGLAEGGHRAGVEAMRRGLGDPHPAVRSAACLALSWLDDRSVLGTLERLVTGDPVPAVQEAAVHALSRMRDADLLFFGLRRYSVTPGGAVAVARVVANE